LKIFVILLGYTKISCIFVKEITTKKIEIMPIELLYTDKEIVKIQKDILMKKVISSEELEMLKEINDYMKRP